MLAILIAAESAAPDDFGPLGPATIPLAMAGFAVLWVLSCFMMSYFDGWAKLAEEYRDDGTFKGRLWRMKSARFGRFGGFENCLTIGGNRDGLYLGLLFLFRPGHPPVLIPWEDVTAKEKTWKFFIFTHDCVELTFRRVPSASLRLTLGLARKIEAGLRRSLDGSKDLPG